jgi:2',3'-cyclic-nucleotide 2'-phosphodiesterase (5'-nucleotidase family)
LPLNFESHPLNLSQDLHDGAGVSDATSPNGLVSNPIFENIDYDLLAIGNHELYVSAIAYEHFNQFAKVYGEKYLTSNVQILNPKTNQFEYIGQQYRYFTTANGKFIDWRSNRASLTIRRPSYHGIWRPL